MSPRQTVLDFLDHLAKGESDEALALLSPEVEWRNTGLPTYRGERVHAMLRDMVHRGITFEVEWHHAAASGNVVLTDRTDVLGYGSWSTAFRVRGAFEVRDGLIVVWDDAFSWLELLQSGFVGLGRMLSS